MPVQFSFMQELLSYHWEKYVGRRQPPLRGELAFRGVLKWFKDYGFIEDFSKLYIYFSKLTQDKGIISDHYINVDLRKIIVDKFKDKIKADLNYADQVLADFKDKAKRLDEFSLVLKVKTDFSDLVSVFNDFCQHWEDFGPNLYIFLLLSEAVEDIILDDFKNDPEARTKLMKQTSAKVESEFFASKNNGSADQEEYYSGEYKPYVDLLAGMTEYRDKRKIIYERSWYKDASVFFRELGDRTGLGEVVNFLSKQNIIKLLQDGKSDFVIRYPSLVYGDRGKIIFRYGLEVQEMQEKILRASISSVDQLAGTIACKGKAKGRVRLIEPHVNGQIFEPGEILVTRMTTPDLMPLIKKAAAIITDEGGITCHAAIVSRELDVPCLIGTKYATQVFKDGDLVEVDAERGKVRKIAQL